MALYHSTAADTDKTNLITKLLFSKPVFIVNTHLISKARDLQNHIAEVTRMEYTPYQVGIKSHCNVDVMNIANIARLRASHI